MSNRLRSHTTHPPSFFYYSVLLPLCCNDLFFIDEEQLENNSCVIDFERIPVEGTKEGRKEGSAIEYLEILDRFARCKFFKRINESMNE